MGYHVKVDQRHRYKVIYLNHRNEEVWDSFVYHFEAVQFADRCGFRFKRIEPMHSYLTETQEGK